MPKLSNVPIVQAVPLQLHRGCTYENPKSVLRELLMCDGCVTRVAAGWTLHGGHQGACSFHSVAGCPEPCKAPLMLRYHILCCFVILDTLFRPLTRAQSAKRLSASGPHLSDQLAEISKSGQRGQRNRSSIGLRACHHGTTVQKLRARP